MSLVRCERCGEVADLAKVRTCMGCDHPLPEAAAARPPRRIPPAQCEAGSDLGTSKAILWGLLIGGGIPLTLILVSWGPLLAAAVPIGIVLTILVRVLKGRTPETPSPVPSDPPPVAASRWTCAKCGTVVEPQFDACWSCSTPRSLPGGKRASVTLRPAPSRADLRFISTRPSSSPFEGVLRSILMFVGVVFAIGITGFVVFFLVCLATFRIS